MRKKLLFGLLFAAMTAGAVKMKPGINIIKQADGTTITVRAYGDEDLSYFLASDGTLLYQEGTNFYIAGVKADGTLYSTGVLAHEPSMRTIKEISAIKAQNAKAFYNSMETQAKANKVRREPMTPDNSLLPSLGKHKIPVILVEFSDVEFSMENPKATFDKYLNGKELFNKETDPEMGQNYASVAKYFKDMSFGKFEPEFEVYGPVNLGKPLATYGAGYSSEENMGLPDLYPKSGSIAEACINQNMDYWSLMDAGEYTANGYRPTAYTAWERERLGWMEIGTLTGPSNVELKSLDEGGAAFRIYNDKDETGHEYYIVENVQNNGWNKNLFGNGLMVTHVDYLSSQFSLGGCKVNNTAGHPRMHVMAADGMFVPEYFLGSTIEDSYITFLKEHNADLVAKYGGQVFSIEDYKAEAAGDLFPGTSNATSLTDDSQPMKAWTYNGETMGKPITDITNDTEKGIVSFKFMGGGEPVDGINEVTVNKTTDSRVYSISGTYMGNDINSLPKGIYIRNGKKVINN